LALLLRLARDGRRKHVTEDWEAEDDRGEDEKDGGGGRSAGLGLWGFGSMLAVTLSWSANHSILWMILHGICSWFYVIYYAIRK
jgi:hypothetical protein